MILKKIRVLFFFYFTFLFLPVLSQEKTDNSLLDLIGTVTSDKSSEDAASIDIISPELFEVVNDYYSEAIFDERLTGEILSYVVNVYGEHGYHEAGNWAPSVSFTIFKPYQGELPEFEINQFKLPVKGILTSGFGYRPKFHRNHKGIDISLKEGDPVVSALPGVVVKVANQPEGYGLYVVLAHAGGVETCYAHLSKVLVNPGQKLNAGETLGLGGTTGNSTGPHLHFETRYLGTALDPIGWFNLRESFK